MGRNATIFTARHQNHGSWKRNGANFLATSIQSHHQKTQCGKIFQYVFQVVGPGNGQMSQRSSRGFFHDGRQSAAALARQKQAFHSHANAGPDHSAQIPGILDSRGHHHDGIPALFHTLGELFTKFGPLCEFAHVANRNHALMPAPQSADRQFLGHQLLAGNTIFFGEFLQFVKPGLACATLQEQALDAPRLAFQEGLHRMLATDDFCGVLPLDNGLVFPGRTRIGPAISALEPVVAKAGRTSPSFPREL